MKNGTVDRNLKRAFRGSFGRNRHRPFGAAGISALALGAVALTFLAPGRDAPRPGGVATAALSPMAVSSAHGPGPGIWLTSLEVPGRTPFALDGYETGPVLPRAVQPLPPLPDRDAPQTGQARDIPPPTDLAADAHRPAPPAAGTPARPAPGFAATLAAALNQQARDALDAGMLGARLAPRRSLVPPVRPMPEAPVPALAATPQTVPDAAPRPDGAARLALARSRLPQRRPETVTRLASADLSAPALAPSPVVAPSPAPSPVVAPALSRALARADRCDPRLTRAIPRRGRAAEGSALIAGLADAHGRRRDEAVLAEIMQGNMPDFLRDLVPVTFTGAGPGGQETRVTICVTPDYLAVGSDRDFVRVPLGLPAATRVAERFDMVLPTTTMVDAIYRQASVRLAPSPMTPGPQMESTGYFQRHNATVQQQLASAGGRPGQLVSGHKKDLVLTNRLERNPGRVAIYGWHRTNGSAIQPLSTVHGAQYADYSHGIRLVARTAYVNGQAVDLRDLLADGRYAGLLSDEGPITNRTLLAALR